MTTEQPPTGSQPPGGEPPAGSQPPIGGQPPTGGGPPGQPWYTQMWAIVAAIVAVVVIAIIVVVVAFVGGDGDGDGDDEIAQASPTAEEPAGEASPTGDAGEDGDGAGDGGLADLEALASEAAEGVIAKVTYRVTTELEGNRIEQEWMLVQRPPDTRFETSIAQDGEQFRTIAINSEESYICFSAGGEESCLASTAEEAEAGTEAFGFFFDTPRELAEEAVDVDLVDRSERRIAGLDATCFTISGGPIDIGEVEVCFSDDGILLLWRGQTDGESSIVEATSVSTDVTDADFEPPYEIFKLPELDELPGLDELPIPTP